jgi:hypothetical protein
LKKEDLGGFENLRTAGIYGKRDKFIHFYHAKSPGEIDSPGLWSATAQPAASGLMVPETRKETG